MLPVTKPASCEKKCHCNEVHSGTRFIVLTGGPGAGKTAVLEIIRKQLCEHVVILPESASIVFGGGFWRLQSRTAVEAAQRAIVHVQQEMERLVVDEGLWALGLCDRGILDALAYWPGAEADFWRAAGTTLAAEYARYHSVIHLRTPNEDFGYNHANPLRTESAAQAKKIDERIHEIWSNHPHYHMVESTQDFLTKAQNAIAHILTDLPSCCAGALNVSVAGADSTLPDWP